MNLCKSIDFLLENAGPVIQYRLRKEILNVLTQSEEESLLEQIYQTPRYKELLTYIHPSGYIGIGAHSADRFKQSPLDDGEAAARLLSYYAIPKENPVVAVHIIIVFQSTDELVACYEIIKPDSITIDPMAELPYSKLAVQFIDKYGVQWGFMVEEMVV